MTVDVAICTRDRPDDLRRCLASLAAQTLPPHRVLVVNGGRPLEGFEPPVEVMASKPGLPRQRNVALAALSGDVVAFLDDDVELAADYLERAVEWLAAHPETIGVSGNTENDVPFSSGSRAFRRLFALSPGDGRLQRSGDLIYLYHPARATRVDSLSGSNMVWRRAAVDGLRFDESLEGYAYMEDVDFSLRASARGQLWVLPDARLRHNKTTTSRIVPRAYVRQVIANGAYLFAKHRRSRALQPTAYGRRLLGRSAAYVGIAARTRSLEPLIGLAQGVAAAPAALRRGGRVAADGDVDA